MSAFMHMEGSRATPRIAVVTFTYEGDRQIAFELLESLVTSFQGERFDLFLTDDASASRVGDRVLDWAHQRGIAATCLRDEQSQGFRGAVDRTIRVLSTIAAHPARYDVILRIDTDALVIREGLALELLRTCTDPRGLYGVVKYMRPRDRIGLLADLLPVGLKRRSTNGQIEHGYGPRRVRPVWWWGAGLKALVKGFDFGFVEGSCYALGGQVPAELARHGYLGMYRRGGHGLITSEEDIIVTILCRAAGLPLYELDKRDRSWRDVNTIGERALDRGVEDLPFVIHPLKPTPEGAALRARLRSKMPLFRTQP
jgi:hypothetical protein